MPQDGVQEIVRTAPRTRAIRSHMNASFCGQVALLLAAVAAALWTNPAEAQHRAPSALSAAEWAPAVALNTSGVPTAQVSFERILVGSALGTIAGAAVGTGLALLVYSATEQPDGAMFGPLGEMVLIGLPVTAAGAWVGTRIASGGVGNPGLTGLGAVVGVGLGVGLGVMLGDATGSEVVGVALALPIAIALPALAEWVSQ
jgi:hypothetical protein